MTNADPKTEETLETLKKDVAGLKADVSELKGILLQLDMSEQKGKDDEELKKIEAQME